MKADILNIEVYQPIEVLKEPEPKHIKCIRTIDVVYQEVKLNY